MLHRSNLSSKDFHLLGIYSVPGILHAYTDILKGRYFYESPFIEQQGLDKLGFLTQITQQQMAES